MTHTKQSFNAAAVGAKFNSTLLKFDKLLAEANQPELTANIRHKLRDELKDYRQTGILSVAFIGQYNAGKSTTISALTGQRDIRIDSDIATDKTSKYSWNGITLIDTPGLFTDRQDHNEITYEAINKADLLVFCLTYMLFDSITVENFKKLAYDKGYRWKMMLLVNKMSDEAGEEAQKIANYRQSISDALKPYNIDEFPICFIDAKDYCEGIDEQEEFLLEASRFKTFINTLNQFVTHRGAMSRWDTPVRIALACVDDAQLGFTRNSNQDNVFLEVLTRLSRTVYKERNRLQTQIQNIVLEMSAAVVKEGANLAAIVGSQENFEQLNKQIESNVQKHYEQAENRMQEVVNVAIESIKVEVANTLQSNLVKAFVACLDKNLDVSAQNIEDNTDTERLKGQFNMLNKIGNKAGVQVTQLATKPGLSLGSQQGFLRSIDVAGSGLHQGILQAGKFIGFKFKPWEAVKFAKIIGNAAKFVGPALALASIGMDVYESIQEHQREKQMADVRRDITSQFQALAKDLENQINIQFSEFNAQVYGEIEQQIAVARHKEEEAIATSNVWVKQLLEIRKDFESILKYITKASE
jgi:GTP-binding protein EngB required for normal cell division